MAAASDPTGAALAALHAEKTRLRTEVRARRRARGPEELAAIGRAVADRLDALVAEHRAGCVAAFLAAPAEPDTRGFLARARAAGIRVLLPVARDDGALDWVADTGRERRNPRLRVPEPIGAPLPAGAIAEAELIVLPAALVDRTGARLGWGGGYYDRMLDSLERRPPLWALVHDDEIVERVPCEPHDIPVDGAITSARRLSFAAPRREDR